MRELRAVLVLSTLLLAGCSAQAPGPQSPKIPAQRSSPAKPAAAGVTDGTYLVGKDIPAGTYRTLGVAPDSTTELCIWELAKDDSGGYDAFIDSRSGTGPDRITLKAGQVFRTDGCRPWTKQ